MIAEQVHTWRGRPVIVTLDNGQERNGYVEFGDDMSRCVSVATEPAGARVIVYRIDLAKRLRFDPGGIRPLRDQRGIVWRSKE